LRLKHATPLFQADASKALFSFTNAPMTDPYQIDMTTLIEASPLLGHRLEDRTRLRLAQEEALGHWFMDAGKSSVNGWEAHQQGFSFGCIDFLVELTETGRRFIPIEFNGTGTGGITNILGAAFQELSEELEDLTSHLPNHTSQNDGSPIILMPYYHPSRLIFEKILLGQALKTGFQQHLGAASLTGLTQFLEHPDWTPEPLVLIAPLKDLMNTLVVDRDLGQITLCGRPVVASFHDVFLQNFLDQVKTSPSVDFELLLKHFLPINSFYPVCSDKSLINPLFNRFFSQWQHPSLPNAFPKAIVFQPCHTEEKLIESIYQKCLKGEKCLIKPHGGGIGTGIEFFMTPHTQDEIKQKIHASQAAMLKTYGDTSKAYPYTLCDFIDAATIQKSNHPLKGHKFELRVVVYRRQNWIKAFPTHVKISAEAYDPSINSKTMLMNNHVGGSDPRHSAQFRLPLCNRETLSILDVSEEEMLAICQMSTAFVANLFSQYNQSPQSIYDAS
jgi:hypothetical protein